MSNDQLTVRDERSARVLALRGEIDIVAAPELQPELSVAAGDATAVVLDLTEVTFFDSSGVRLVDQLARECARHGVLLRVAAPQGGPSRAVLDLVGMPGSLVVDDVTAALAAVRSTG